ncbi:CTP synthase (glutamine hydrolyzing) [Methanocorpusculum sp.]|nr:CTP synthase (glutamine hydrolyzing) [Methanocorpusculum sp.]MBO5367256.1 CTP synthase (glutamine hydrolyzing) [Methanocorpusculum sp.]
MKYVVVTGGVMSGLGKGITAASIGRILINRGYHVTSVKIDPYLNIDAGLMNPAQHGEVFVLKDGGESDLDLGNYERFLDIELTSDHNLTTGKIYQSVITKERHGDYLGATVQIIPHITDEIKDRIKRAAETWTDKEGNHAEICIVEVGGTVGDIESMPFLEAVRQMHWEYGNGDFALVHVTLLPADTMGDLKTKPTQHSVKALRELGLEADIIVGRSSYPISPSTKRKIASFCDVDAASVISARTAPDTYLVPLELEKEGMADVLLKLLRLEPGEADNSWYSVVSREYTSRVSVGIITKYGVEDVYISIKEALKHAGRKLSTEVDVHWLDAEQYTEDDLRDLDGILIPGGFGNRGVEGMINAIRFARENNKPLFGICLGFQLCVIEFMRNVVGYKDATSEEMGAGTHAIALLPEQEGVEDLGGTMRLGDFKVSIAEGSRLAELYGATEVTERHRHRYEVNPAYIDEIEAKGMKFVGRNGRRMEALELDNHPYFVATQFHPEFRSRPTRTSAPFVGFVAACRDSQRKE